MRALYEYNAVQHGNLVYICGRRSLLNAPAYIMHVKSYNKKLKENSVFFKARPYFLFEIRLSTHREQFGEDRRPLRAI